jgi:hypothetical protein
MQPIAKEAVALRCESPDGDPVKAIILTIDRWTDARRVLQCLIKRLHIAVLQFRQRDDGDRLRDFDQRSVSLGAGRSVRTDESTIRTDGDCVLGGAQSESEIDRLVWVSAGQGQVARELREAGRRNAYLIVAGKQVEREGSTRGGDDGFLFTAAQEDDAGGGDRSTRGIGDGSLQSVGATRRVATGNPRLGGRRGGSRGRL